MRSDDVLLVLVLVFVGIPCGIWFYRDDIFGFLQMVDLMILKGLSFTPFIGDYYASVVQAYEPLAPSQLTWRHVWIAGQVAWRPIGLLVLVPIMLRWAWVAWKTRRAQAFNNIDKAYIIKHCGTKQSAPDCGARQQWVVRRWYQHYDLHRYTWGGVEWNKRLRKALAMQLGKSSSDPESQALIKEFADFVYGQVVNSFGEKQAKNLPAKTMVEEATRSHAYCATAMVRVLAAARDEFGVLSPQGFRNRLFQSAETVPIWFALNGLHRQTTHAESLGVLSHFYVEVAEAEPLTTPQLDNAVDGLEKYRKHLIDQRKLRDLDQSEDIAREEQRAKRKESAEAGPSPGSGYEEGEHRLA